jgi:uncharacterized membrane protein YbhN (UPF0104 family)
MSSANSDLNAAEGPRIALRQLAFGAVTAVLVGAVLIISIGRLAGFTELTETFDEAEMRWLGLSVIGQMLVFAGYAGAFRRAVAFEDGPEIPSRHALRVIMASFAMTQLVATGGAAGLAFTYWALRTLGFETRRALVRLIALNTAVYLVFAGIGWTGAVLGLIGGDVPLPAVIAWITAIPLVLAAASWFTDPRRVDGWIDPEGGRLRAALSIGVEAAAWVRRALGAANGRAVFAWALLYWIGDLLSLGAALLAYDFNPGMAKLVVAYTTGYLAQLVPIPFIATGGVDAATTFTLTMVGAPIEVALLAVVTHRVFAFWLPIGPGLWSAFSIMRQTRPDRTD